MSCYQHWQGLLPPSKDHFAPRRYWPIGQLPPNPMLNRPARVYSLSLAEQTTKCCTHAAPAAPSPAAMAAGLVADPFLEELAVSELAAVSDARGRLGLAGVETEQSGDRGDHVCHGEVVGAGDGHDVRAVKLDGSQEDATLGLTHPGLNEGGEQREDGAARRAPRGGPEGEEGGARRGRQRQVCVEGVRVADSAGRAVNTGLHVSHAPGLMGEEQHLEPHSSSQCKQNPQPQGGGTYGSRT